MLVCLKYASKARGLLLQCGVIWCSPKAESLQILDLTGKALAYSVPVLATKRIKFYKVDTRYKGKNAKIPSNFISETKICKFLISCRNNKRNLTKFQYTLDISYFVLISFIEFLHLQKCTSLPLFAIISPFNLLLKPIIVE
jgi:hypothetical protein